ncbi:hypothetical protein DL93DRAFT_2170565 [Clavulina sp. PMI_390]|nr:hypothetical protein DL93DRAFT_2170565 [Clavulina sp. PMI_390]
MDPEFSENKPFVVEVCTPRIPRFGRRCFLIGFELSDNQTHDLAYMVAKNYEYEVQSEMFDRTIGEDVWHLPQAVRWLNFAARRLIGAAVSHIRVTMLNWEYHPLPKEAKEANRPLQLLTRSYPLNVQSLEEVAKLEDICNFRELEIHEHLKTLGFDLIKEDVSVRMWAWPPPDNSPSCYVIQSLKWAELQPHLSEKFNEVLQPPKDYEAYYYSLRSEL